MQHRAQDAVYAKPRVPEASVGVVHFPFGPRGSRVSGRHLTWVYPSVLVFHSAAAALALHRLTFGGYAPSQNGRVGKPDTRRRRANMAQRDVLIVEEDRQVREVLHQIFLGAGYNCLLASDGGEGLEVFRRARPPLVVTDLGMPMARGGERVRDAGITLLQQVRQEDPDAAVIVEGGAADVRTWIRSLKLGAYAFLMKPINVDELLITAERALERRHLLIERRQYRTALEALGAALEVAKTEIQRCAGTHFDPGVVASFFKVPEVLLEEIRRESVEL